MADIVLHEALSHPEIAFRFLRDGKQQFMTPGDGQLRSAAYAVLGRGVCPRPAAAGWRWRRL